jgi:hypothetical protein
MKTLQEQSEIVKQRLHYHFAKVGGGWNIEGMNAPFMKEFLNEVERLCALLDVVATEGKLPHKYCSSCGEPIAKPHKFWCTDGKSGRN